LESRSHGKADGFSEIAPAVFRSLSLIERGIFCGPNPSTGGGGQESVEVGQSGEERLTWLARKTTYAGPLRHAEQQLTEEAFKQHIKELDVQVRKLGFWMQRDGFVLTTFGERLPEPESPHRKVVWSHEIGGTLTIGELNDLRFIRCVMVYCIGEERDGQVIWSFVFDRRSGDCSLVSMHYYVRGGLKSHKDVLLLS